MEFIAAGQSFDIEAGDVLRGLRGHEPERLHRYTVTIDGKVWPVKQAFSVATGLPHHAFTSQAARRLLKKVGFEINEDKG